jgi:predicted nucleic acid-binding Zn ribbon protein
MQLNADRYGNGGMYRGCIHDGVCTMKGSNDMQDDRDKQEKNTLFLYQVLGVLVLLVVMAQAFMYMGYMIGELL